MTVRLTILYPNEPDGFFDFDYYLTTHMPLSAKLLGPHGFLAYTVQEGVTTVQGESPPQRCITHLDFASIEGLRAGMLEHGAVLRADFFRYTDITPVATVCDVLESRALGSQHD